MTKHLNLLFASFLDYFKVKLFSIRALNTGAHSTSVGLFAKSKQKGKNSFQYTAEVKYFS